MKFVWADVILCSTEWNLGLCLTLLLINLSGQTNKDKGPLVEMKMIISCFVWAWGLGYSKCMNKYWFCLLVFLCIVYDSNCYYDQHYTFFYLADLLLLLFDHRKLTCIMCLLTNKVELGLWQCLFILVTLSLPSGWVRLVMMGIHCFFILVTLSLPSGWVRLVTMGIYCFFILVTLSLPPGWVRLVTMRTHCLFILVTISLPRGWVLCFSMWQLLNLHSPYVNVCFFKSLRWRCSTVCRAMVTILFCN